MQVRALVCGSNYGRYYVDAIGLAPDRFHLAGILARSSNRSQRLAQRYGVPLYRTTSELPDQIDLACAAMSSSAAPVVLQLLERGIHVLCEHPQRPRFLREALDLAGQRQVRFHVNGHFPDLPAPRSFITRCQQLHQAQPVRLLHIMVTDRTLYTGLDIVIRAIGDDRVELRVRDVASGRERTVVARFAGLIFIARASGPSPAPSAPWHSRQ